MSKDYFGWTILALLAIGFFSLIGKNIYDKYWHESRLTNQRTISGRVVKGEYNPGFLGFWSDYTIFVASDKKIIPIPFYQIITSSEQVISLNKTISITDSVCVEVADDTCRLENKLVGLSVKNFSRR